MNDFHFITLHNSAGNPLIVRASKISHFVQRQEGAILILDGGLKEVVIEDIETIKKMLLTAGAAVTYDDAGARCTQHR